MMDITPVLVRSVFQSAVGKGLKFPSLEFEEFVAKWLDHYSKNFHECPVGGHPVPNGHGCVC